MKRMLAALALMAVATWPANGATTRDDVGFGWIAPLAKAPKAMQLAQAADAAVRINQLDEEVRSLNGKIEDLNFTILQLQEQMRKMQEDNEFRFQEIEKKRGALGKRDDSSVAARRQQGESVERQDEQTAAIGQNNAQNNDGAQNNDTAQSNDSALNGAASADAGQSTIRTIDGVEIFDGTQGQAGAPQPLGKLIFDANGNLVDTAIEKPVDLTKPPVRQDEQQQGGGSQQQGVENQQQAALPPDPAKAADQVYDLGYTYVQAGDYRHAAKSFGEFVRDYPRHAKIAEANFWLGESLLAMKDYEGAAKVFLDAHKKYPSAKLAPQTLLKLGVSLAGMNQRELACATFAEVGKQYPKASDSVRAKVASEQKAASCTAG